MALTVCLSIDIEKSPNEPHTVIPRFTVHYGRKVNQGHGKRKSRIGKSWYDCALGISRYSKKARKKSTLK